MKTGCMDFKLFRTSEGRTKLSLREQEMFCRRVAMLLRGGVGLLDSLTQLARQDEAQRQGGALHQAGAPRQDNAVRQDGIARQKDPSARLAERLAARIEVGQEFAIALAKSHAGFDDLTLAMISLGENTGTLGGNLEHAASALKKRRALRRAVVGAAMYPAFVLVATLGIASFLAFGVLPRIEPAFRSMNAELPFVTRLLLGFSGLFETHGLALAFGALTLVGTAAVWSRTAQGRDWRDRVLIAVPIIGALVRGAALAGICRSFGLLIGSGESVASAARAAAASAGNREFETALKTFETPLAAGQPMADCFRSEPRLFPSLVAELIEAGERSGTLAETFLFLATVHEEDVDELAKGLGPALEPLLLVAMGGVVGFVALAIIMPIYALTSHLSA